MLQRELTYQLSFERLAKLSRSATKKAFPAVWRLTWLCVALFLVAVVIVVAYADTLRDAVPLFGLGPELLAPSPRAAIFFAGARWIRTLRVAQLKRRATFNQIIRLTQDEGGLRVSHRRGGALLKWKGISQMNTWSGDGVAVSHGALFSLCSL